jgi:hypothetical protein
VLGRIADDRHDEDPHEHLRHADRLASGLDGADQDLAHPDHEPRGREQQERRPPSARPVAREVARTLLVFLLAFGVVQVAVRHQAEDQVQEYASIRATQTARLSSCSR